MRRDTLIIAFVGALTLLLLLVVATRQTVAFLPFAFLYLLGFAGQVLLVYGGSQWAGMPLKGFFGRGGLCLTSAPYIVANLVAYVLVIMRKPERKHTL